MLKTGDKIFTVYSLSAADRECGKIKNAGVLQVVGFGDAAILVTHDEGIIVDLPPFGEGVSWFRDTPANREAMAQYRKDCIEWRKATPSVNKLLNSLEK